MTKVSKIIQYINKYDEIITDYPLEKDSDFHIIVLPNVMLLYNQKEDVLEVSFSAGMKPDIAGSYILSFQTIPNIKGVIIMECYFYDNKDNMIWGEDAFNELEKRMSLNISREILTEQDQIRFLMSHKGHEC